MTQTTQHQFAMPFWASMAVSIAFAFSALMITHTLFGVDAHAEPWRFVQIALAAAISLVMTALAVAQTIKLM